MLPEQVVQKQLDCYNAHDIDGFMSTYANDIKLFELGDSTPFIAGCAALRQRYLERFSNAGLHAEVVNRMRIGYRIIDHECITGLKAGTAVHAVAVYEVNDDLIQNVWFLRE